jgi:hypothetical protein
MAKPRRTAEEPDAERAQSRAAARRPVLGQAKALSDLTELLVADRVPPSLILHGPGGVGKMTVAKRLAALLLDPAADRGCFDRFEPPADSQVAELLAAGTHPDLHLISKHRCADSQIAELRDRKQTNIPIDLLRELMIGGNVGGARFDAAVQRTPYLGHGKVFLLDEAELLDSTGQNALLKVLEEPPSRTWIVLCVTDRTRLLPTIRSRCHQIAFSPLDEGSMRSWFDGLEPSPAGEARRWLAQFAEGSPGRAMLAIESGLLEWEREIGSRFDDLASGRGGAGFPEAMADLVKGFSESQVKRDPKASKEAANRLASRILLSILGARVRRRLVESADAGDLDATDRWTDWIDRLDLADRHLDANVSLLHALADLVAGWERLAAAPR